MALQFTLYYYYYYYALYLFWFSLTVLCFLYCHQPALLASVVYIWFSIFMLLLIQNGFLSIIQTSYDIYSKFHPCSVDTVIFIPTTNYICYFIIRNWSIQEGEVHWLNSSFGHTKVDSIAYDLVAQWSSMQKIKALRHGHLHSLLTKYTGDVTFLKSAMTLASTVIHKSGTDREKHLEGRIRNNG